jgi:hypothetical protein
MDLSIIFATQVRLASKALDLPEDVGPESDDGASAIIIRMAQAIAASRGDIGAKAAITAVRRLLQRADEVAGTIEAEVVAQSPQECIEAGRSSMQRVFGMSDDEAEVLGRPRQ